LLKRRERESQPKLRQFLPAVSGIRPDLFETWQERGEPRQQTVNSLVFGNILLILFTYN
jgi:hypothetical protein